jgi:hypothetical protein
MYAIKNASLCIALLFGLASTAGAATIQLTGTIRDFNASHPDFEGVIAVDPGIVQATLGLDGKPVYANNSGPTTSGRPISRNATPPLRTSASTPRSC